MNLIYSQNYPCSYFTVDKVSELFFFKFHTSILVLLFSPVPNRPLQINLSHYRDEGCQGNCRCPIWTFASEKTSFVITLLVSIRTSGTCFFCRYSNRLNAMIQILFNKIENFVF